MKSRFTHLALCAMIVMSLFLASIGHTKAQSTTYKESPMLAELVKAGKLPPVEQRLPENPRLIELPGSDIGTYGGDFKDPFVGSGAGDAFWTSQMIFFTVWRGLVNWNQDYNGWTPNVAESVETNADATVYTFHLRKGLKWSDGVPFTSDDVLFYVNDIMNNPDLTNNKVPDGILKPGSTAAVAAKIDDSTFTITFDVPYGLFLLRLCTYDGWAFITAPQHYLKQFHTKYNSAENIKVLIEQTSGASDWVSLFQLRSAVGVGADPSVISRDVEYPTMFPWVYKQPMGTGNQFIAERNPYYYWVDKNGNQLPYLDRVIGTGYKDDQTMLIDALAGKFDTVANTTDKQKPLFAKASETSGLVLHPTKSTGGGVVSILFNETHPEMGALFSQKDFRIGMSHAIDRKEVIDSLYFGQGQPRQVSPVESSPLYNEQLSKQFLDYDVDKANAALDKVLPEKDADGFRLDPVTKNKLSIVFSVQTGDYGARYSDLALLLKKYYAAVGVDIVIDTITNDELGKRGNDNTIEATIFTGEGGWGITSIFNPRYFVAYDARSYWGNGWALWYLQPNNAAAVEPPQAIKDQVDLYKKVVQAATEEERLSLMKQVLQIAADNFWVIGIVEPSESYHPVSAKLANIPANWVWDWDPGGYAIAFPEQWYFKAN
jgi:peptide/nickel transport system substrate-binding protein